MTSVTVPTVERGVSPAEAHPSPDRPKDVPAADAPSARVEAHVVERGGERGPGVGVEVPRGDELARGRLDLRDVGLAREIFRRLKEFVVTRQTEDLKARLQRLNPTTHPREYEALFTMKGGRSTCLNANTSAVLALTLSSRRSNSL